MHVLECCEENHCGFADAARVAGGLADSCAFDACFEASVWRAACTNKLVGQTFTPARTARFFSYRAEEENTMRKTTNQRDRLLQIEKLECRCFPSAVLPAVAAAPIVAAASSVAIESTAVPSPAAHAAAGAIFVSPTFASPAATNAPAASGNLPNVVGSQGVFSPRPPVRTCRPRPPFPPSAAAFQAQSPRCTAPSRRT